MSDVINSHASTITIMANGQPRTVKPGSTIADLLRELDIVATRVVAQLDGVVVSRDEFGQAVLGEGCRLEVVTMVGGG